MPENIFGSVSSMSLAKKGKVEYSHIEINGLLIQLTKNVHSG